MNESHHCEPSSARSFLFFSCNSLVTLEIDVYVPILRVRKPRLWRLRDVTENPRAEWWS